jgi:hypothetical protein
MNKKLVMAIAICVGFVMLIGTAFADVAAKTGYVQAKDAVKATAAAMDEGFKSGTLSAKMNLKYDGKIIASGAETTKIDFVSGAKEVTNIQNFAGSELKNYSYNDNSISIRKDSSSEIYYVTEFSGAGNTSKFFTNPFKMKEAADIERIIDAVVGNMKDFVVANDIGNGNTEISASISEGQVPSLINAVTSFAFKQAFQEMNRSRPSNESAEVFDNFKGIKTDIYVKNANGKMTVNKDGVIVKVTGSGTISGRDEAGVEHEITGEVVMSITNIDSTIVQKPNLEGKTVEKSDIVKMESGITGKFAGTYKEDIISDDGNKIEKIGERFLIIAHADSKVIEGRYYETYKDTEKNKKAESFTFAANTNGPFSASFTRDESDPRKINYYLNIDQKGAFIYFGSDKSDWYEKGESRFSRVFD